VIVTLFIGGFMAAGFAMLGYGLWTWHRSVKAGGWPVTPGKILQCTLVEHRSRKIPTFCAEVKYQYTVNGQDFINDTVAFGYSESSDRETHEALVKRLQHAEQVQIRYDPDDPQTAALSFGLHQGLQFKLLFALAWLALLSAVAMAMWTFNQRDDVLLQNLLAQ